MTVQYLPVLRQHWYVRTLRQNSDILAKSTGTELLCTALSYSRYTTAGGVTGSIFARCLCVSIT